MIQPLRLYRGRRDGATGTDTDTTTTRHAMKDAISTHDTDAAAKIAAKIAHLEAMQDKMKAANAAIRKGDNAALAALGFSESSIAKLKTPDYAGRIGFHSYELTNNSAEIRRLKARLPRVEATIAATAAQADAGEAKRTEHGNVIVVEDWSDQRVHIEFPGKPSDEARATLRGRGFKWSPTRGAWVRQITPDAIAIAHRIAQQIAA